MAPQIHVKVRVLADGSVTRHYGIAGSERAFCGRPVDRSPTSLERWAPRCRRCEATLEKLERSGS